MARRLVNTTIKNQKDTFEFELWDMDSSAADLDHTVEFDIDGFSLQWKGGAKDTPLMPSTMQWTMFLTEAQRSAIMPVVFSDTEFRMCVRVMQGNNVFWCGVVHAEETTQEIGDGIITVSLQASDGLGMLSNIDYKDAAGERYSGSMKVRDAIWAAIGKLPHISLMGGTGTPVLKEHSLNQPLTQNTSEIFLQGPVGGLYYGVMDYLSLNPNTFYYSNIEEENVVGGTEFGSVDKFNPDDFTNSKLVVKDIMSALGATICFADGKWHVWDKTVQFNTAINYDYKCIEWNVTQNNELDTSGSYAGQEFNPSLYDRGALNYAGTTAYNNKPRYDFLKGASLKAEHSVRGVTQKHVRAGSDLLYANGVGYHDNIARPQWEQGESMTQPLINLFRNNRQDSAVTGYPDPYAPRFNDGTTTTFDGLFDTRNRDRIITDIQIPNGNNDGSVRIHLSGNANYTHKELNRSGSDIASYGTLGIYKQRVEITDGTSYWRLSRPVRTIAYDSEGNTAQVAINGGNGSSYAPKFWSLEYEWIENIDARYNDAWLDIPLGASNAIIEEGSTSKFMQTDYPAITSAAGIYTPPLTKLASGSDNTLTTDNSRDVYVWRHDYVYDMPAASGTIEQIKIHEPVLEEWEGKNGPNVTNLSDGTATDIGVDYLNPTYRTKTNASTSDGHGTKPNGMLRFQLSGIEVMFGDGTQEFDQNTVAFPTTTRGREILNLNGTRLGASFVNTGGSTHGRFTSGDYLAPTDQEDNLKFGRPYDTSFKKESLSELVTANMLQLRGKIRQTINCSTILAHDGVTGHNQIILPFNRLVTDTLDDTTRTIVPYSVSYSMTEGRQRIEGWLKFTSAEANVGSTTEAEEDSTRGPLPSLGNFEKPSGVDLSDFTHAEATDDTGGTGGTGNGGKFGDLFPMFIRRI